MCQISERQYAIDHSMEVASLRAVEKLSKVVNPAYADKFADMLWWAYENGDESAIDIANSLHIDESEIWALANQEYKFIQAIQQNQF